MEVKPSQSGFGEEIVLVEEDEPQIMEAPLPQKSPVVQLEEFATMKAPPKSPAKRDAEEDEKKTEDERYPAPDPEPIAIVETPAPIVAPIVAQPANEARETFERDFDSDPTALYTSLQNKSWQDTVAIAFNNPEEARIWVSRKEKDGRMRWRLLPIHAAIVFKAPEEVIEALLTAYPEGAQAKDDQGMLPLHLAMRTGSTEGVVNMLLFAYPQSIDVQDRKGRVPLVLAQASSSPNREAFMKALERGPTYYAVAAAATERATEHVAVVTEQRGIEPRATEQRAVFDSQLVDVHQSHQHELAQVKLDAESKQQALQLKLAAMEKELAKTQETSQVLVDHVNSLEAQLASRSDTERFLATKIATLDSSLKDTSRTKEEVETNLKTELVRVTYERDEAAHKLSAVEMKYQSAREQLEKSLNLFDTSEKDFRIVESKLKDQVKELELDLASEKANTAILDAQLKKKIENEHGLASQVSALAGKLAEAAAEARDNTKTYANRIRLLEEERQTLRESVQDLTKRLSMVARVLEQMVQQQSDIMKEAKAYEEEMSGHAAAHAKIVGDAMRQEMQFDQAKEEREQIRKMLEEQEKHVQDSEGHRNSIMNAIAAQGQHMENSKKSRDELMSNVQSMGAEISGVLTTVLDGIPRDLENEEEVVDTVVKAITADAAVPTEADKDESAQQSHLTPAEEETAPIEDSTVATTDIPPNAELDAKQSTEEVTVATALETVPDSQTDCATAGTVAGTEEGDAAVNAGDRIEALRGAL